jgi:hypothetical protein
VKFLFAFLFPLGFLCSATASVSRPLNAICQRPSLTTHLVQRFPRGPLPPWTQTFCGIFPQSKNGGARETTIGR